MKENTAFSNTYALSEVVGGLFLVLIAILAFVPIYMYLFPLPIPPADPNMEFMGYTNEQGYAVVEHMGGEPLGAYEIYVDGELIYECDDDPWEIGERNIPTLGQGLIDENDQITVAIYALLKDGNKQMVFNGIISGKTSTTQQGEVEDPMLISNFRTNSADEDLICYTDTITPLFTPTTYIYNWFKNSNSIADLYIPFDTDTDAESEVKDYSGNNHNGKIFGPVWASGILGGSYLFDGNDDYIELPYCYDDTTIDKITVEAWIKPQDTEGTIASYGRDNYWELGLTNGKIRWSTTSGSTTYDATGTSILDDLIWHHIAATYNSNTGKCKIFIDGELELFETAHSQGAELGSGNCPTGTLATGTTSGTETIFSTSFETQEEKDKWTKNTTRTDDWAGNGMFDLFGSDSLSPQTGSYSIGGTGSMAYFSRHHAAYDRETIDISDYEDVKIGVWYSYKSTENDDEFGLYYKDSGSWTPIFEDFDPDVCYGCQLTWTYAEKIIPNDINNLDLEFWWSTSEAREYLAIDDLVITGTQVGGTNFSGNIDEFAIYNQALSDEQIHQNYLCKKDGFSDRSIIVSDETNVGNTWQCIVTPNEPTLGDDESVTSNTLEIVSYNGG